MASLDSAVLTQILAQLESLQLSQQVLQAKVISFLSFCTHSNLSQYRLFLARLLDQSGVASHTTRGQ